jgi:DNA-directed RNA polymerase subunit RPC12/RpoP
MLTSKISCPHCTNADGSMIEKLGLVGAFIMYLCLVCSRKFAILKE